MQRTAIILAATLGVAGFGLAPAHASIGQSQTAVNSNAENNYGPAQNPVASQSEIRGVIARAADYALTPMHSDMSKLVSLFPSVERDHIRSSRTYSEGYGQKLDARIESINRNWKEKYGNVFMASKAEGALGESFASIETKNPGSHDRFPMAFATIKGGDVSIRAPFLREGNDWRINVPAYLTAEKLRGNLLAQLTDFDNDSSHWPANESRAYRMVSRRVMAAVLDQPISHHAHVALAEPAPAKSAQSSQTAEINSSTASSATHHWYEFWKW